MFKTTHRRSLRTRHAIPFLCVLVAAAGGCEISTRIPADGPRLPVLEAGVGPQACEPDATVSDFWHCGACDRACPATDSDRCVLGHCRCGGESACGNGADCRFGRCVDQDPTGRVCEFDSECDEGFVCVEGRCSVVVCTAEICDGIDNDCDGYVDGDADSPLMESCYSGDPSVAMNAPCQTGFRICNYGRWTECLDETLPVLEQGTLACDGIDNDCDGCADGVYVSEIGMCAPPMPRVFDVVFLIDASGSMVEEIAAVRESTDALAQRFEELPSSRFALLTLAGGEERGGVQWVTDFTTVDDFRGYLAALRTGAGDIEPSYDAIHDLGTGDLDLAWRPGSLRIIVLFTDERGQSVREPRLRESDACEALRRGEVLAVVTQPSLYADFDACALLFELTDDSTLMAANLETIVSDPCD